MRSKEGKPREPMGREIPDGILRKGRENEGKKTKSREDGLGVIARWNNDRKEKNIMRMRSK